MTVATNVFAERPAPGGDNFEAHAARYLRAAGRIPPGSAVVDAGCGLGYGAEMLAASRHTVIGVDVNDDVIREAAATYPAARFVAADVLSLPFRDATFDAAVCFEVIEHVRDPRLLVDELARVLRPGGLLFISTPNARMERLHARSEGYAENPYHVSPLGPRALRGLLREAGLRVRLYGQARDRGILHVLFQGIDPLGLRLRIPPRRRPPLQAVLQRAARIELDLDPPYRFSRLAARSAAVTYAEARNA